MISTEAQLSRVVDVLGPKYVMDSRVGGDEGRPMLASAAGRVTTPVSLTRTSDANGKTTVDVPIKRGVAKVEMPIEGQAKVAVASGVVTGNELEIGGAR